MFYKFLLIFANITGDTNDNTNDTSSENIKKMAELPKELAKLKVVSAAATTGDASEPPEEGVVTSFTGLKKKKQATKKGQSGKEESGGVDVAKEVIELTFQAEVIAFDLKTLLKRSKTQNFGLIHFFFHSYWARIANLVDLDYFSQP